MADRTQAAGNVERTTMRAIALRLVPFLMLCYFFNLLDRSNIGVASLQMRPQLGLSAAAYGLGGSLFFVGYFLFEVPSNLALEKFGARRWVARIMISWGVMCGLMALARGPLSFYVLRFLLGIAEAGFFPGIVLYATYWFPSRYRARIVALFSMSVPMASFIGSPLSAALLQADGFLGLHGWQWVFIAEGIPTVLLGLSCLFLLPDRPANVTWLAPEQRSWLSGVLATEAAAARPVEKARLIDLARSPIVWGLAIVCGASSAASSSLSVWQPQLIKSFGLTNFQAGLVNSIPYGFAIALMMFWGMHSDRTGERRWHAAAPLLVIAAGLVGVSFATGSLAVTVALLSCVLVGYSSFKGPFWAFTASVLSPAGAAAGIAGINAFSNLIGGGMVSVVGLVQGATHSYALALLPIAGVALLGAAIVLAIGHRAQAALSGSLSRAG